MNEVILSVKDLSLIVRKKSLLENINFSISKGDYVAISGLSGSGKSLLIKSLLGLVTEGLSGEILYHGIGTGDVTYIPQNALEAKDDFLGTAKEVIAIGLFTRKKGRPLEEGDWEKVDEMLEILNLSDVKDKKINKLTQWQQFRVKIAKTLIVHPRIIFIDTPPSSINIKSKGELYKILKNLCEKYEITIIHIVPELKGILTQANKVLFLDNKTKDYYFGGSKGFSTYEKEKERKKIEE
ncbi:ATP-binding cassette domain-containing protein [Fusobacterium sp. PH5-44]|uniref:ATP-binding cassette domain-containing protein n=1 Tax=unclassified Fusobacterium TaxID=2648384 RepID=UPI003D1BBDF3